MPYCSCVAGNFLDLLFGENLRVEDGIHIAAFIHRAAEGRQVLKIGFLEAAQKNPDGGDTANDGSPRLGLGLALIRLLISEMDVRVENAWEDRTARRVINVCRG